MSSSTIETASSLFDSADPSEDIFAQVGSDARAKRASEPVNNIDDIFGTGVGTGADAQHGLGVGETSDDSWLTANADSYGNASGNGSGFEAYAAPEGGVVGGEAGYGYPADDNAQLYQGYYDEHGEWHTYESQDAGGYADNYNYYDQQSAYNPEATATVTQASYDQANTFASTGSQYNTSTAQFDSYGPPQSAGGLYEPSLASNNPYTPIASQYSSSMAPAAQYDPVGTNQYNPPPASNPYEPQKAAANPYVPAPASNYNPQPTSNGYSSYGQVDTSTTHTSAYEPYNASAYVPAGNSAYAPASNTAYVPAPSTGDLQPPAAASSSRSINASAYGYGGIPTNPPIAASIASSTMVPPPPKPSSAVYTRPATFDAYDPPIPPPKPSKKLAHLTVTPASMHDVYTASQSPYSSSFGQQNTPVPTPYSPAPPPSKQAIGPPPRASRQDTQPKRASIDGLPYTPTNQSAFSQYGPTIADQHTTSPPSNGAPLSQPQHNGDNSSYRQYNGQFPSSESFENGKSWFDSGLQGAENGHSDHATAVDDRGFGTTDEHSAVASDLSYDADNSQPSQSMYGYGDDSHYDDMPRTNEAPSWGMSDDGPVHDERDMEGDLPSVQLTSPSPAQPSTSVRETFEHNTESRVTEMGDQAAQINDAYASYYPGSPKQRSHSSLSSHGVHGTSHPSSPVLEHSSYWTDTSGNENNSRRDDGQSFLEDHSYGGIAHDAQSRHEYDSYAPQTNAYRPASPPRARVASPASSLRSVQSNNFVRNQSPGPASRSASPAGPAKLRQSSFSPLARRATTPTPLAAIGDTSFQDRYKPSPTAVAAGPVPAEKLNPYRAISPNNSNPYDPPAPLQRIGSPLSRGPQQGRSRTMTNDSSMSYASSNEILDPYAPRHTAKAPSTGSSSGSHPDYYSTPSQPNNSFAQELSVPATYGAYAPSPSLLGTNDPLGRTAHRVPVVTFGFGGKLVTCFHRSSDLDTGFDISMSSRKATNIQIRTLNKVIPESALDVSSASYPGPLYGDPNTASVSLVRTGQSAQVKSKKSKVIQYLTERSDELSKGVGYLAPGNSRWASESKLTLVRLLKVLVEHDGQLSGSAEIDAAVRTALVPRFANSNLEPGLSAAAAVPFMAPNQIMNHTGFSLQHDRTIASYSVRASNLDRLQDLLLRGEKQQAYQYALDEKLWAHAMVISSSVDKEAFKEVVNEFIRSELGSPSEREPSRSSLDVSGSSSAPANGRECLRVAYSLFSGQAASSVQQLSPLGSSSHPKYADALAAGTLVALTPMTPNFTPPAVPMKLFSEVLSKWQESAAMMITGQMNSDSSLALTALGDQLAGNLWFEAAHCCYLLSPMSSAVGAGNVPAHRIVLVGSESPLKSATFQKDMDAIVFSEILEFAYSLRIATKSQDPFAGLPHLQSYKFIRATQLAELGYMSLAKRYCDAITASSRGSGSSGIVLAEQLKELVDQMSGNPEFEKNNTWMGGRIAKPSVNSISDWVGNRLTKFVAGDGDSPTASEHDLTSTNKIYASTFSHYSTISSETTSTSPSPAPSFGTTNTGQTQYPPRADSAASMKVLQPPQVQVDRAASAMDYYRPTQYRPPSPRIASASATISSFSQVPSFGQAFSSYGNPSQSEHSGVNNTQNTQPSTTATGGNTHEDSTWWGSSYEDSNRSTPTAATFFQVDSSVDSSTGFVSLMDDPALSPSPAQMTHRPATLSTVADDDEEDLGLSTVSKKKAERNEVVDSDENGAGEMKKDEKEEGPKRPDPPSNSGSWFGKWWNRGANGPIKASLGEETSFYYDKDLKKWVNKKTGGETATPSTPPPPPSRVQTASPSGASGSQIKKTSLPPPPIRPASAAEMGSAPPMKGSMRVRSNLVPVENSSAPPTPAATQNGLTPPPTPGPRPKSSIAKRNVRSRYVDVFQQPGNA